jgi:CRP-like cAMP-binding protein
MSEGEIPKEFIVIGSGRVRVSRTVGDRTETVSEIGAGGMVGEIELLDGSRRMATAVAATDLTVFVSTGSEFRSMLRHAPSVAHKVRRTAVTRAEELGTAA